MKLCAYCEHRRGEHRPDKSHSSHKADQHKIVNYTPAHCTQPNCTCVMFAETPAQVAYCRLPDREHWLVVVEEARRLGTDLAPIRPSNLIRYAEDR